MSTADISKLNALSNRRERISQDSADAANEGNPIGHSRPLSSSVILLSLASLILVLALGFFAAGLYQSLWNKEVQIKLTPIADSELAKLRTEQAGRLNEYRWVDQGQQRIAIPIERAMQLTVERLKSADAKNKTETREPR